MRQAEPSEPIGQPFLGRYRLIKKIAVGGMAELYLARASGVGGFEKNVVVKRILPQLAASPELFQMFLDEARIAASLDHPNVIQVYDACREGDEYFIAMEYLDGTDLRTLRKVLADRSMPLPWEHAMYIGVAVAAGLHYAHEKKSRHGRPLGIVHRDVTPHNVFLTREGGVKLVDFGIAKAEGRVTETESGTLKGKLAYMSPEQCRGGAIDRRSDVYSLGILMYELSTGRRLYSGTSEYELLKQIVEAEVAPPSSFMEFPAELEVILMRCLAKDPASRFQTARDVQRELETFARSYHLPMSALGLSSFLEPLLDDASVAAKERWRRRYKRLPRELSRAKRSVEALNTDEQASFELPAGSNSSRRTSSDPMWSTDSPRAEVNASGIPEMVGAATMQPSEDLKTARVHPSVLEMLAEDERRIAELEAVAEHYSQPHSRPDLRHRFARGTGELEPGDADNSSATLLELDDLDSASYSTPILLVPKQKATRATVPQQARARVLLPAETTLPRGRGALWILLFLVVAAGGAGWYFLSQSHPAPTRSQAAPTQESQVSARPAPASSNLVVQGQPGSDVWLFLGRSPVEAYAVHDQEFHRVRVEHEGYRSKEFYLGKDSWRRRKNGQLEAIASVVLEKDGGASAAIDGADDAPPATPSRPSRLRVDSAPRAAGVWLYLGKTPSVRAGNLDRNHAIELRIERPDHPPQFLVVDADDFAADGTAQVNVPAFPQPAAAAEQADNAAGAPADSPKRRWKPQKAPQKQWKPRAKAAGAGVKL